MNFFNFKKKEDGELYEHEKVDKNQKDKLQVVVSRLENDTKVTIKQFWATHWVDPDTRVAYWINDSQKFKQPVSDYYLTTIKSDIKKNREEIDKEIEKNQKIYDREIDAEKPSEKYNIKDIEHKIEVLKHQKFLLQHASKGYSVLSRNLQNYRKIEYLDIGNKLYPLGFNPKLMTYFIIPIDKDITLDKHRENITLKHTNAFQKLIASATILMLILVCALSLISGIAAYKLYFAYDNTHIAELERVCASSSILNQEQYILATEDFRETTESFTEFVNEFQKSNQEVAITPQNR